jgi:hypothetical protein
MGEKWKFTYLREAAQRSTQLQDAVTILANFRVPHAVHEDQLLGGGGTPRHDLIKFFVREDAIRWFTYLSFKRSVTHLSHSRQRSDTHEPQSHRVLCP